MNGIDDAIAQVERLYRSLTGRDAPDADAPYAPIPPERDPQSYVEQQLDRLLEALGPTRPAAAFTPPITVADTAQEIVAHVDLPGVPRDAVEVLVDPNAIVVSGRRPAPANGHANGANGHANGANGHGDLENGHHARTLRVRVQERPIGPFRRVVPLPTGVAPEQATAQLRDGVLELRIPRGTSAAGATVHRLTIA